ncbi:hypothetical protein BKA59DRAFT_499394, partial [Fusarium tricinctum]
MQRDNRSRDPEGSRRRWYESRDRDPRDQDRDQGDSRQQTPRALPPHQPPPPQQYPQQPFSPMYQQTPPPRQYDPRYDQSPMYQQSPQYPRFPAPPQQYHQQRPHPYTNAPPQSMPAYNDPRQSQQTPQRPQTPSSVFSSSSDTSTSLLDISRFKDTKQFGGVFGTFFKAPSDRVKQRLHRKKQKKRRVLYFGNSSSSSVNSDLAYGYGYVKQPKSRTLSPRSQSRASGQTHGSVSGQGPSNGHRRRSSGGSDRASRPVPRKKTADEEIMALGQQLSDLARRSKEDEQRISSRGSGKGKAAALGLAAGAAGAAMGSRFGKQKQSPKGKGKSKHRVDTSDDGSEWEDASDDEGTSSSDDAASAGDSELAYGTVGESIKPAVGVAAAAGSAAAAAAMADSRRHSGYSQSSEYRRFEDRGSIVDPRLFGPYNSLRGSINTPCGFRDEGQAEAYRRDSGNFVFGSPIQMRDSYPGPPGPPGPAPAQFSASGPQQDSSPRPAAVPLQQPVPKLPVSSKVYETEKYEDVNGKESRQRRQEQSNGKSWSGVAAAGLAAAAASAALASSSRKDSREHHDEKKFDRDNRDRREQERIDMERQKALEVEQQKLNELERQKARELERYKNQNPGRQYDDWEQWHKSLEHERERNAKWERDYRETEPEAVIPNYNNDRKSSRYNDHDDTPTERKEKKEKKEKQKYDIVVEPQRDQGKGGAFRIEHGQEFKVMNEPVVQAESSQRNDTRDGRDLPLPTGAGHQAITKPTESDPDFVDPFQYQVADDAFTLSQRTTPGRPLTPNVVTVEREPNFDDSPPRTSAADARLSRRDSFEIERMVEDYRRDSQDVPQQRKPQTGREYEKEEREAKSILDEAKMATIPVAAVAVASAVAVEHERSKGQRKGKSSKGKSQQNSRGRKDAVQEEADRYYRESCIARKIASEEMRSRSASPEPSVVDKWQDDKNESFTIVTPPAMEDKHTEKSIYEGPDADVKIDNKIYPQEERRFRNLGDNSSALVLRQRDISRERPVLNLIYPTPAASRQPTPAPAARKQEKEESFDAEDVIIGPKGEILPASEPVSVAKSVSWGENETKRFDAHTPEARSETENYFPKDKSPDKPRPKLNKASRWGILAAALAGSSAEPHNEPDVEVPSKQSDIPRNFPDDTSRDVLVQRAEAFGDDASREPPVPGPKPASPHRGQMPGGYADDLEFAATLAAGLKDTGFNPDIVIEDPSYSRRDSPPGVQEANGDSHGNTNGNSWYKRPYVDPVPEMNDPNVPKLLPEQGFVLGEVETPQEKTFTPYRSERDIKSGPPKPEDVPLPDNGPDNTKLSKREQRKRDKSDVVVVQDDGKIENVRAEPSPAREVVEEVWEDTTRKKGKKKDRKSRDLEDDSSSRAPAPFDYNTTPSRDSPARDSRSYSDWSAPRDEDRSRDFSAADIAKVAVPALALGALASSSSRDTPSRDVHSDDERDARKKSRKQLNEGDYYDDDRSRISSSAKPSHHGHSSQDVSSRDVRDDEFDESKHSRKHKKDRESRDDKYRDYTNLDPVDRRSSRRDGSRDRSRDRSRHHSRERSRHRSRDRSRDHRSRDHRSRDRTRDKSRDRSRHRSSKRHPYGYDSPSRSLAASEISLGSTSSRRSKKSKRRSGNEDDFDDSRDSPSDRKRDLFDDRDSSRYDDDDAKSVASSPGSSRRDKEHKERRTPEKRASNSDKKDSFLASAATIIASDATRSNAADASSNQYHSVSRDGHRRARSYELVDPEVVSRVIKPAIDPQYGDLLPLPPSEPSSPISGPEDLPPLPDSRPDTPPQDRTMRRDMWSHQRRRSAFDTPIKSPSRTAVPIALRLGNRSNPGSPVSFKTSPVMSRRAARPTSWDSTREIMPLYLLEHSRHQPTTGSVLPALPPKSEFLKHNDNYFGDELDFIGPDLRDSDAGSEETTPQHSQAADEPTEELDTSLPLPVESTSKDMGRDLYSPTPSPVDVAAMAVPAALAATAVIRGKERADSPTERADDLESADEHFSDAFEGHSEPSSPGAYVFRALASSFDDRPSPRVQYGYEPITYPMAIPPQEPVVEEPVAREPASKELVAEEPIAEKSFVQEPPINSVTELLGLPAKEPAVEEPTTEEPSVEQTIVNEPTNDPVTDRALVKEQPVDSVTELLGLPSEKAKTEEPTVQEPTYYPATEPAIEPIVTPAEEPVVEEPTAERSFVEEPPIDSVTELLGLPASKATTEEPIVQEPTYYPATGPVTDPVDHHAQQTIVKEPIVEEPAAERSFVGESPIDSVTELLGLPASTVITEQPIVQEPTYYPATEPVAEPANEAATESIVTPAGEPAIEKPTAAKSLIEESPVDSVTELLGLPTDEPTVQEPVIEQPTIEEPIVEEPTNKESPVEEPSVESVTKLLGLPMEAPTAKESVAKEPTVEESTHEEPSARSVTELLGIPAQEPAVEKPEIEEPTTEGPTVEQRIDALEPTVQYGPQPFNESVVDRKVEDTYPVHQAPGTGSFEQPAEESSRDLTGGSTAEDVVMPAIDSSFHPTQESATESIVNATPEIVEPVGELENGASREPASALREINKEPNSAPVSEPMVEDVPAMEPAIKTLPESTAENTRGDARQADTTLITPAPETVVEPPPASATEATPEPTSEVIEAAEAKPEGPVSQRGEHEITTEEWESMTAKDRKNMKKKLRKKGQEPIIKDSFDAPVLPQESSKAIETAQNEDNSAKDQSPETTPVATGIESLVEPVPDHSLESLAEDSHAPKTIDAQEPVVSQEQQSTTMEPKEPSELVEEVLPAHQGPSTEQDAEDVQKDPEITSTPAIAEPEHDRTLPPSAEPQLDTENTSTTPLTMAEEIIEDPKESPSKSKKKKKIKAQQQAEEEVAKAGPTVTETEDPAPAPTPEADRDAFAAWTEPDVIVETPVETPVEPAEAVAENVIAEPVPDAIAETVDVPEEMQDKPTAAAESAPEVPVEPTRDDKKKKKGNKADDESAIDNTETPRPEESAPVEKYQANEISPDLTRGTTKTESAKTTQLDKTQTPPPIMPPMNASTWRFGRGKSLPPVVAPEPDDGGIDDSPPSSPRPSSSNEGRNALRALPSTAGISAFKRMWGFQDQSKAENKSRQAKPDTTLPDAPTQADPVTVEKSDVADVKSDAPDTSPSRDLVTNDKLDAESAEKSETADIKPDTPVADLNREIAVDDVARPKFDSFISEPLFSQDSAPLEESQLEASQIDEPQNNSDKLSRDIPQDQIATEGQSALEPVLEQAVGENPRKITEDDASKSAETQDFQPTSKETEKPIDVKPAQDTQENLVLKLEDGAKSLEVEPVQAVREEPGTITKDDAVNPTEGAVPENAEKNKKKKKSQANDVPQQPQADEAKLVSDEQASRDHGEEFKPEDKLQADNSIIETEAKEPPAIDDKPVDESELSQIDDKPSEPEIKHQPQIDETKDQPKTDEKPPADELDMKQHPEIDEVNDQPKVDDKPKPDDKPDQTLAGETRERARTDDIPANGPELKEQPQTDDKRTEPQHEEQLQSMLEPEPKEQLQTDNEPSSANDAVPEAREAEEKATREAEEAEAASENAEMESLLEKKSKRKALEENATRRAEERATREAENQVAEQEKPEEAQNKDVPQASGEITTERTSDTSAIPLVPNEGEAQDAGQSTEDPVSSTPLPIAGQTEENHNTVDTAQPTEQQDAVVADEGVEPASSKKSKKKKKRKSVSFVENGEAQDTATDNVEPPVLAPEPQLLGQSTASTEAPITEEASNTPVDEHTVNDVPPTDAKQTEGHPLAMSEEPVAESAPVEPQPEDTADPVLNDAASEAPSEAPSEESSEKKSKKKKKKKKNASSSDEPETQPGAESQPQETPEDATPQDTSPNASNATESGAALPLQPETNTSHEPVLADEEQTQPADVNIPVETPPTQEPAPTVEADKADKANIRAPDQPVADDSLNIEDPDSPAKLSKKDKKKKKKAEKKKAALEGTPDPESDLATPSQNAEALPKDETADLPTETSKDTRDETPKQTDTNGTPDKDSNLEGKLAAPADDAKTPDTGDSGKLPSEEPAGPEDERGGFSLSQSQTDQKNKAKDNDFEILQDPETKHPTEPNPKPEKEDADVTAVDEAKSQGPSEGNEPEEDKTIAGDLEVPVKPEAKLEPGSELGEEKLEDNEEFAGLSKKQIKKLKKVKALAALEPPLEPSPPKEPEPSNEETLEPAAEAGSEAGSKLQTQSESAGAESPNKAVEELGPEVENETSSEIKETVPIDEPNFEAESKSKTETQSLGGPDTQPATEPAAAEPEADADVPTSQPESQQQMTPDQDIIVPAPEVKSGDETHAPHEDSITNIATDQEVVEEDRADLPRQPPQETLEVIQTPVMAPGANPEHSVTDNTNVTEPVLEDRSPHALDEKENIAEPSEDREALEQDAVLSLAAPVSPLEVPADALAKTLDNDISQETADDIIERKPKDPESSGSPHRSSSATIEQPTKPLESNDDSADLTGIVEPQQQAEAYPVLQPPGASEVSPVPEPEVTVPSESVEALTPPVKNVDEAIAGLSDVEQNKLNEDQKKEPSENAEQPEESTQPVGGETSLDTTIVDDVMVPADRSMPEHKQEAVPEASPSAPVVTDTDQGSAPEVIDDKREEETAQSFNDKTSEHVSELLQEEPLSESTHFVAMPDIDVRVAKASDGQVAELLDQVDEKKSVEDPTATKVEVPDTSNEPSHVRDLASPVQPVSPPAVTDTVETKVSTTSAHERAENEFTTEEWQDLSAKDRKNIKKKLKKKNLDLVIKDSFEPTASANDDLPQIAPELVSATPQTKPTVIQETPENDDLITEEKKRLESQDEPEEREPEDSPPMPEQEIPQNNADLPTNDETKREQNSIKDAEGEPSALADVPTTTDARPASEDDQPTSQSQNEIDSSLPANGSTPPEPEIDTVATELITESNAELLPEHKPVPETTSQQLTDESSPAKGSKDLLLEPVPEISYVPVTDAQAEPLTERPPEPPVESRKSSLVVTEPELIGETTGSAKQETQMPSMEHTPEHQMKNESEDKVITPSTEPLPTDMAEQPAPDVQLTGIENTNSPVRAADDNNETKVEQESAPGVEKARDVTLVEMPPSLEDVESAEPAQPQQEPIAEAERPSLGMADAAWQTNDESTITGQAEAEKEIPLDVEPNCKDTKTVVEDEKEEKVELNDNNEEHAELEPVPIPAELPEEQRSRGNTVLEAIDQQTVAEPAASEQFGLDASFSPERQPADPLPTPISHQDDKQEPAGQKPEKQEDPVKSIDVIEVPAEPSQPDTAAQVKDTASLPLSPKDKKKKKRKSKAADSLPAEPTEPAEPTGQPYTEPPRTYDNKVTTSPNDATAENPTQLATPSTADVLEPSRESDQTRNSVPEAKQEDVQDNKGPFLDNSVADREDNTLEGIPLSRDVTLAEGATTDMPPSDPLAAYETLPSVGNESPSVVEAEVKTTDNPSPPQSSEHSLQVEEASIAPVKSSKKDKKNKKKKQKQIDDDADTSRDSQDGASSALLQVDQPVKGDSPAKQPIQLTEPVPETSDLDKSAPTAGEPGTSVHAVFEPVEEVNPPEPDVIDREVLDQIKDTPLSESGTLGEPLAAEQTRELVQETQASQSPPEQTPEPQSAKETETTDMTNTVSLVPLADKEDHQSGGTQEIISQDAQPEQPTGTARDFAPPADSATMDIDVPASYKDVSPVTEVPRKASIGEPTTTNAPRHLASADDHATEVPTPSQAVSPAVGVLDSITEIPTPGSQPSSSGQTTTMPADDILAAKIAKRERKLARKLAKERAAAEREAAEKPTVSDGQDPVLPSSNKSAQSEEPGKPVSQKEDITQKAPTT